MKIFLGIFFFSLLFGQLGGIPVSPGVFIYIHDIVLAAMIGTLIVRALRVPVRPSPRFVYPIGAFLLAGAAALAVNAYRLPAGELFTSSLYLLRWAAYAGLYVVIVAASVPVNSTAWVMYGYGAAFAGLGFLQYLLYPDLRNLTYLGWDPHFYRLFSTLLDPNFAGIVIVLVFFLGLYLRTRVRGKLGWLVGGIQMLLVAAIYLTYSRSALLGFLAGAVTWIVLERRWKLFAAVAVLLILVVFVPTPGGKTLRLLRDDTTIARVVNWGNTLELVSRRPLLGYGFNTLPFLKERQDGSAINRTGGGVDSSLLFVTATTGVVGTGVFVWLVWRLVGMGISLLRMHRPFASVYLAQMVAIGVDSLFINSAFYPWVVLWLWTLVGVAEVLLVQKKRTR